MTSGVGKASVPAMPSQLPANRLRELREARGLRRLDIAYLCRVEPITVQRWERKLVPQEQLPVLAEFFGVSIPYLAGWTDEHGHEVAIAEAS